MSDSIPEKINKTAKAAVDATLVPLIGYIRKRLPPAPRMAEDQPQLVAETIRRAIVDSADYAEANMAAALCFSDKYALWRQAFSLRAIPGLIVEFGVWKANSTNFFASMTKDMVYGFDSFEGLKEDWAGWSFAKGHFNLGGQLPRVAPNVKLIKGWFDQSLGGFLAEHPDDFSFIHIDCDTYEATVSVLNQAADRIVPGTVALFDEYFGYRGWRMGEYKAWQEFTAARGLKYDYRAFSDQSVVLTVR
jgi:hypothetical protein